MGQTSNSLSWFQPPYVVSNKLRFSALITIGLSCLVQLSTHLSRLKTAYTVKLETLASGNIGEFGESGSNRQT